MLQHLITHDEDLRMAPVDRGELIRAVDELREELQALDPDDDPDRRRVLSRWIGIGSLTLGDHGQARTHLRQALGLAAASGNTRSMIATELNLGDAHRYAGQAATANGHYLRALVAARCEQPELVDFALQHLAKHLLEQGELAVARTHLEEALRLRRAKGDDELITSTLTALQRVDLLITTGGATPHA